MWKFEGKSYNDTNSLKVINRGDIVPAAHQVSYGTYSLNLRAEGRVRVQYSDRVLTMGSVTKEFYREI